MRTLEICILLLLFINLFGYLVPKARRPRALLYLPFLTAALTVFHLVIERSRWQMVPAYLWCAVFLILAVYRLTGNTVEEGASPGLGRKILAGAGKTVAVIAMLLTAAVPWLFPVVDLPQPTGPYAVGTTILHIIDVDRPEALTDDPDDHREFMVRVWYPAEPAPNAKPMPYWPDADIIGPIRVKDDFHKWGLTFLPTFFFNHFDLMRSNSYPEAPIASAEARYPVILFSPGGGVIHERNFLHHEELASHGYIVFSLSAPYDSWAVIFPDGRVIRGAHLKAGGEPTEEEKQKTEKAQEIVKRLEASTDVQERKDIMRALFALDPNSIMDKLLYARVADARFTRDELERLNSGQRQSPFRGRLDLERAGIFGMSLGGAVTGQVCLEDTRFKAGINLDGTQFGTVIDGEISQPFMFMNSGDSKDHNDFVYDRLTNVGYSVTIAGSSHMDYTDMFYTSPFVKKLNKKAIRDDRMAHVANSYIVAFFDSYLKGQTAPLLDGPSEDFPEVTFKVISNPEIELTFDEDQEGQP
jgi:predicted dienelactone hydrolase